MKIRQRIVQEIFEHEGWTVLVQWKEEDGLVPRYTWEIYSRTGLHYATGNERNYDDCFERVRFYLGKRFIDSEPERKT